MADYLPGFERQQPTVPDDVPAFGLPHKPTCTPQEAAMAIGISERQIRNWIETGELAAISSNRDMEAALRPHWRIVVKWDRPFNPARKLGLSLEEVVERRKSIREGQ
jgi:hypothetical protein